jgi:hypothetical protein
MRLDRGKMSDPTGALRYPPRKTQSRFPDMRDG